MKPQLIYHLRYRLLHPLHLGHSNTPGCCQTHYKENNHDALPDPLPSNAQWQGRIGEDPFRKCSVLRRLHTLYRLTYKLLLLHCGNYWQYRYTLGVSVQTGSNYFVSFLLFYVLVSANLPSSVASKISLAGSMLPLLFISAELRRTLTLFGSLRLKLSQSFKLVSPNGLCIGKRKDKHFLKITQNFKKLGLQIRAIGE